MEIATVSPPQDVELEQRVLGGLIAYSEKAERAIATIKPEYFSDPLHQRIFSAIESVHKDGHNISPITISSALKDDDGLKSVGGGRYIVNLVAASPALPDMPYLIKGMKTVQTRRELFYMGEMLTAASSNYDVDVPSLILSTEQSLYLLADRGQYGAKQVTFSNAIGQAIKRVEEAAKAGGRITGLPTGLTELDQLLGGLQKSDLIIVAGRPGMGKTALATNIAFHIAQKKKPVLFFSLEMTAAQLSARVLSEQARVEMWKTRCGQLSPAEWDSYVTTGQRLDATPLHIDDSGGVTLPQIVARARRAKRELKIELIVLDYIQLMDGMRKDGNRVLEISEITKGLKALAKELDVPVVALSQLSRGVDARDDKRPMLSDLRDSGSIEQDADVVMFVFRHEYYLKGREPDIGDSNYSKWQQAMERCHGRADILIEKHRHGATDAIKVGFNGKFTKFSDWSDDQVGQDGLSVI